MSIVTKRAKERVTFTRGMRVKVTLFLFLKSYFATQLLHKAECEGAF